jgi:hypothetical protein
VDVLTDAAVSGANAVFSLSKNGVNVPAAAVTINVASKIGSVTGLDVALVKGDEIVLNLASGAVSSPVTLNLVIDDGIKVPNFRSVWNMATEYSPDDVVQAGGNSYIALTTNTNQPPDINADDWEIFTAKGTDGINGTDGEDGANGSVIRNGAGAPADALGSNGDYYINTTNYDLHHKAAGAYSVIGNIKGADGEDGEGGGSGLPTGDLNASTNKIEKIQGYPISLPVGTQTPVDDEFINLTKPDLHSGISIDNSSGTSALFGGEVGTVLPVSMSGGGFARYAITGNVALELKGFINGSNEPNIKLEKSIDGVTWTNITPSRTNVTAIGGAWSSYKLIVPVVKNANYVRIYWGAIGNWFYAYVGRFQITAMPMTDKTVFLYDLPSGTILNFSLAELKAALNALP